MHVCMYVCMFVCMSVCMYACVYVCMYVRLTYRLVVRILIWVPLERLALVGTLDVGLAAVPVQVHHRVEGCVVHLCPCNPAASSDLTAAYAFVDFATAFAVVPGARAHETTRTQKALSTQRALTRRRGSQASATGPVYGIAVLRSDRDA